MTMRTLKTLIPNRDDMINGLCAIAVLAWLMAMAFDAIVKQQDWQDGHAVTVMAEVAP